jgi:hypothetical protein
MIAARRDINGAFEQPLVIGDKTNFAPCDADGVGFSRTPRDVMDLIFLRRGAMMGGFFPEGLRGVLTALGG